MSNLQSARTMLTQVAGPREFWNQLVRVREQHVNARGNLTFDGYDAAFQLCEQWGFVDHSESGKEYRHGDMSRYFVSLYRRVQEARALGETCDEFADRERLAEEYRREKFARDEQAVVAARVRAVAEAERQRARFRADVKRERRESAVS